MTDKKIFADHVWMLQDMSTRPSVFWDITLASLCLIVLFFGFLGNCLAFFYFLRKTELSSQLYKHISGIDTLICICQIPVVMVFFSGREPGMFNNPTFCTGWTVVYDNLSKLYPMAILLLSVSRTIAILHPFHVMKKRAVIGALYIYFFMLVLLQVGSFLVGFTMIYGADSGYCYPYFETMGNLTEFQSSVMTAEYTLLSIESGLPPILTFISFIVSIIALLSKPMMSSTHAYNRHAAITITIFTGIFLFCYVPLFALCALYVCLSTIYKDEFSLDSGPFSNYFMFWYSWPFSRCFLNTLNAMLDVTVYMIRIKDFRVWLLKTLIGRSTQNTVPASISSPSKRTIRLVNVTRYQQRGT